MGKRLFLVVAAAFCFASITPIWAHQGGLDRYGCHHYRKAGGYHCHRGYLAGQHFSTKRDMLERLKLVQAQLPCNTPALPANHVFLPGVERIIVTKARIGCLDIQIGGNLTGLVGGACNDKTCCLYKAPTDSDWNLFSDRAVNQALSWAGLDSSFLPDRETPELRRELFYGGFDWAAVYGITGEVPQSQCWTSDNFQCKKNSVLAARLDRQETYDANFRAWHWRLGAEQLAFSHQQFTPGTTEPLYLSNMKRMLLLSGYEDTCGDLGKHTRDVAPKMVNTPGYARFLKETGHSLDNEHPDWVARQIADFLR